MQVLYHIDESGRWEMTLGNIRNMLTYGRENGASFQIELVANGPAVAQLAAVKARALALYDPLCALAQEGVRLCACANAMRAQHIDAPALCPFVQVVPAGVVEIAARQQEGYAYIKP